VITLQAQTAAAPWLPLWQHAAYHNKLTGSRCAAIAERTASELVTTQHAGVQGPRAARLAIVQEDAPVSTQGTMLVCMERRQLLDKAHSLDLTRPSSELSSELCLKFSSGCYSECSHLAEFLQSARAECGGAVALHDVISFAVTATAPPAPLLQPACSTLLAGRAHSVTRGTACPAPFAQQPWLPCRRRLPRPGSLQQRCHGASPASLLPAVPSQLFSFIGRGRDCSKT